MDELLRQSWTSTAVGVVIGIIATIAVAYAFRSRPRLAAKRNTIELVGPNAVLPTEISFMFRGVPVPKVALTKVAIWNNGNTTLTGTQIVGGDPLRIVTAEGSSILEAAIQARTRSANAFSCGVRNKMPNELECSFDYLDPNDGALIQLIHTGTDDVRIMGTLRGVRRGVISIPTPQAQKPKAQPDISPAVARSVSILMVALGIVSFVLKAASRTKESWRGTLVTVALALLGAMIWWWATRYLPPRRLSTYIGSDNPTRVRRSIRRRGGQTGL